MATMRPPSWAFPDPAIRAIFADHPIPLQPSSVMVLATSPINIPHIIFDPEPTGLLALSELLWICTHPDIPGSITVENFLKRTTGWEAHENWLRQEKTQSDDWKARQREQFRQTALHNLEQHKQWYQRHLETMRRQQEKEAIMEARRR
ncbi:hypothetical protein BDZ91DRAFT_795882 [Kalaharituber pfeilii]|nr:hypothetical protein BDZ91DRAFT_795882 [Kalaharituber pfeilii]